MPFLLASLGKWPSVHDLALDDALYLSGHKGITKVDLAGGAELIVQASVQASTSYVAATGSDLYWTDFGVGPDAENRVRWLGSGATSPVTLATFGELLHGIAADGSDAFVTVGFSKGRVVAVSAQGVVAELASEVLWPSAIEVGNGWVYWINWGSWEEDMQATNFDGSLMKVPRTGGEPSTLLSGLPRPSRLAVDDSRAYVVINDNSVSPVKSSLVSVSINGGPATELTSAAGIGGLAVDETDVYWTTEEGLFAAPKGGGTPRQIAGGQPLRIAVDEMSIYWVDAEEGTVWRLAK